MVRRIGAVFSVAGRVPAQQKDQMDTKVEPV